MTEPVCHFCDNDDPMGFNFEDGTLIEVIPALYDSAEIYICEQCYAEDDIEHRAKVALGQTAALEAELAAEAKAKEEPLDSLLKVSTTAKTRAQLERFAKAIGEKTISKAANTLLEASLKIYFTNKGLDP